MSSYVQGFSNGAYSVAQKIPVLNRCLASKQEDVEVSRVAHEALREMPAPASGGAAGGVAGVCCGAIGGFALATVFGICATVEIWGTGAGLWVQGEKHNNSNMVIAGQIMTLYVAIPIVGCSALSGCCYGAITGGAIGSSD